MSKDEIRMRIWRLMEQSNIAAFPRPVFHRIPNFVGAEKAAQNLRSLAEYQAAKTIFCNPDSPQRPVRKMALQDSKKLIMATPKLKQGFLQLDPTQLSEHQIIDAASIHGAFSLGRPVKPQEVKVDLFVAGSVAVSPNGHRLGKGTGYSDQEYALLKNADALALNAPAVTTVHDVQIVEDIPWQEWDVPVDVIVTPTQVIFTKRR